METTPFRAKKKVLHALVVPVGCRNCCYRSRGGRRCLVKDPNGEFGSEFGPSWVLLSEEEGRER